jgi:hypothetical protein
MGVDYWSRTGQLRRDITLLDQPGNTCPVPEGAERHRASIVGTNSHRAAMSAIITAWRSS